MSERKRQQGSHTVFIACEGAVSEKEYFEAIRDHVQTLWNVSVDVYPKDAKSPNDALSLVQEARKNARKYREVWAVFDKDGDVPTDALNEADREEDGKKVNVGYTSIAFEHWVLLHFEKNSTAYTKSDCKEALTGDHFYCGKPGTTHAEDCKGTNCAANKVRESYIANYNKKGRFSLYDKIKHRNRQVIENAAWLRHTTKTDIIAKNYSTANPYTNLDILLSKLLNIDENIFWQALTTNHNDDSLIFSVNYTSPTVTIEITNTDENRFFINFNSSNPFSLSNEDGDQGEIILKGFQISDNKSGHAANTANTISLFQNDKATIMFEASPSIKLPLNFSFKNKQNRHIFAL